MLITQGNEAVISGDEEIQAMKPYIDIAEKTKVDAIKLFDEALKQ